MSKNLIERYESLKKQNNYCKVIDLIANIKECCTSKINMIKVVEFMLQDKSLQEVLEIPLEIA